MLRRFSSINKGVHKLDLVFFEEGEGKESRPDWIGLDWGLITYIVRSELIPHTNE